MPDPKIEDIPGDDEGREASRVIGSEQEKTDRSKCSLTYAACARSAPTMKATSTIEWPVTPANRLTSSLSVPTELPHSPLSDSNSVPIPGGVVDLPKREVRFGGGDSDKLSRKEFELLAYMVNKANSPVSRTELLREVWQLNPHLVVTRTVDMHVAMLRKKLRDFGPEPTVLVTVAGTGYMFKSRV
jgi:DNA-binding response OmpR family regulator